MHSTPLVAADNAPDHRREFYWCTGIAMLLVLGRSLVPLAYEQFDFDSDQAIVGLMAKHLSERRGFPLFFYGQNYMLGVQAWISAPFFWLGGPTLAMLRLPLALVNIGVVVLFIGILSRNGLRPIWGLIAALTPTSSRFCRASA